MFFSGCKRQQFSHERKFVAPHLQEISPPQRGHKWKIKIGFFNVV
jgi:hypothetical protein